MTTTLDKPAVTPERAALLDVGAVAALLDCSPQHVRRLADAQKMPRPLKLGALLRWRRATGDPMTGLQDWLAAGCPSCRKDRGTGR